MSIIIILISGIVSLIVGYFIAQPFLGEISERTGEYPEYFNDSRSASYKEALENLDYAFQSNSINEEEFETQKVLLLKDAVRLISDKG